MRAVRDGVSGPEKAVEPCEVVQFLACIFTGVNSERLWRPNQGEKESLRT